MNKVIIIACEIFEPDAGGPATFIKRLMPELDSHQVDYQVITYADEASTNGKINKVYRQTNLISRYFRYFKKLYQLSKSADLIFAQGPIAAGLPAILVKKLTGKKIIIKVVGDVAWERARNQNLTTQTIDEFQTSHHSLRISWQKWLRSWTTKQADLVITPSEYLKKIVTGWGVNPEKIKVIYNSFEVGHSLVNKAEAKVKLNLSGDIILSSGRLAPWKGFGKLIEIMPELLSINPNLKLVIVGSGPEETNLKFLISNFKLNNQVILAGQKSQAEMPLYYQAADWFVLNSGYEGLSHTLLESLYYELPTMASNIGGNLEVIHDGQNGLLFEYNNGQQIVEAFKRLYSSKELQQQFITQSKKVLEQFTFERMVGEYLKILQ